MKSITVLLVDDHAIVRAGLKALLETAADIQVIGEAENGRQAISEARRLQPGVVLLDLAMPVLNGVEAARQIVQEVPTTRVLILSSYSDDHHVQQGIEAGAVGFLMKEAAGGNLLEAVRAAHGGEATFSPPVLNTLLKHWNKIRANGPGDSLITVKLSRRQAEVLQLIAEGYCNKEMAGLLSLSHKTVEKHRQFLMEKLKLHKTSALTRYAVSNGVIELGQIPGWRPASPCRPEDQSDPNFKLRVA